MPEEVIFAEDRALYSFCVSPSLWRRSVNNYDLQNLEGLHGNLHDSSCCHPSPAHQIPLQTHANAIYLLIPEEYKHASFEVYEEALQRSQRDY